MVIQTFEFLNTNMWVLVALMLWTLPWKGYALWKAARGKHNFWFIALFLINTLAVLDILYIFVFSKMHRKGNSVSINRNKSHKKK